MTREEILKYADHTVLAPTTTTADIKQLLDDAMKYKTAAVCIPLCYVKYAAEYVNGALPIATVVGFPHGNITTEMKCFEAAHAFINGASEIDMVINIGLLKEGNYDAVLEDIKAVKAVCGSRILKVIIETCLLTEEEKIKMCEIVSDAGADFMKL